MRELATDLWEDLREKRLWPVAAAMVLAIVAIPVLLSGGASEATGAGNEAAPVASAAQAPAVAAVETDAAGDSSLGAYDNKDPFRSGLKPKKGDGVAGVAVPVGGGAGAGGATGAGGSKVPSGSPSGGGSAAGGSGGSSGGSGSGGSEGSTSGGSAPSAPRTRLLTYVVDITFGRRGSARRRNGVKRLAMLPSSRNPLLVFLGVSADREKAVFLVDEGLSHSGEGTCRPKLSDCEFLFLRTDDKRNEHYFTTESGAEYVLKLRDIRAVRVSRKAKKSAKASAARRKRSTPRLADDSQ